MKNKEFLSNLDVVKLSKLIGLVSYKDLEVENIKRVAKIKRTSQLEEEAFSELREHLLNSYEVQDSMGVRDFSKHEDKEEIAEKLNMLAQSDSKIRSEDLKELTKDLDLYELALFYDAESFDFLLSLLG